MNKARENYIETANGKLFCKTYGTNNKGIPLIMVHGGPGGTHDYLVPTAETLSDKRPVILYDQLGCGKSDRNLDRLL